MPNELANATVAAPAAAPAQQAPAIPSPFAEVVAGQIPAVSLPPIEGDQMDPAQQFVVENLDVLMQAGLDYHDTKDGLSVIFNPKVVSLDAIQKAEKDGTLDKVAVPATSSAPAEAPAEPASQAAPAAGALAGAVVAPPAANAPIDRRLQQARIQNSRPAPLAAPNPVPNQLGKRAV